MWVGGGGPAGIRVPVGTGFAGSIARRKCPVVLDRVDSTTVANPILWEKGIQKMLGVPLLSARWRSSRHKGPNPRTPPKPRIPLPAKRKAQSAKRKAQSAKRKAHPTPELPSDQGAELVPG